MLKEIEIQNFRCFKNVKVSGFERVNLIGGKNNSGKTALLEALFLNVTPNIPTVGLINYPISVDEVPVTPPFIRLSDKELTKAYDRSHLNNRDREVLKVFQIIDPAIESVETFSIGEPTLYLRRKGESCFPLSLYGDAINRVADIILKLVNSDHNILLVDEIENGIHYTSQQDFWRTLFRLAVELDTQIFATTHSLEMIQAFGDVGLECESECSSAYFELAKQPKTNQIVGIRRDVETLQYAIEHQKGVRGE